MKIEGTITRQDFEGGFWGIVADDGEKYRPVEALPAALREDGIRVAAEVEPADVLSFQQWGRSVSVKSIERL